MPSQTIQNEFYLRLDLMNIFIAIALYWLCLIWPSQIHVLSSFIGYTIIIIIIIIYAHLVTDLNMPIAIYSRDTTHFFLWFQTKINICCGLAPMKLLFCHLKMNVSWFATDVLLHYVLIFKFVIWENDKHLGSSRRSTLISHPSVCANINNWSFGTHCETIFQWGEIIYVSVKKMSKTYLFGQKVFETAIWGRSNSLEPIKSIKEPFGGSGKLQATQIPFSSDIVSLKNRL